MLVYVFKRNDLILPAGDLGELVYLSGCYTKNDLRLAIEQKVIEVFQFDDNKHVTANISTRQIAVTRYHTQSIHNFFKQYPNYVAIGDIELFTLVKFYIRNKKHYAVLL